MQKFRRSRHVISYWAGSRVHLQNYATGTWLGGSAALCAIADACSSWRSMDQILETCSGLDETSVRRMVQRLSDAHVLHRSDRVPPIAERAMARLSAWNPAAGVFHTTARNTFYNDDRLLAGVRPGAADGPPWPVKRYPGRDVVPLPVSAIKGELAEALLRRRSWRRFGEGSIGIGQVAKLLQLTAGMLMFVPTHDRRKTPLRTSPSAGACHPIEVYVLALRVEGLARGLYHYASDRHQLECLRRGVRRGGVQRYLPTQYAYEDAAVLVFFCSRYDRLIRRYPFARAYRAAAIEAGHLCQTFLLTATCLGLAPFCSMALHDHHLEQDLGLDGVGEAVVYAAGVGVRPPDSNNASAPPGVQTYPAVPNPRFRHKPRKYHALNRPSSI